jgi:hypothetical protein
MSTDAVQGPGLMPEAVAPEEAIKVDAPNVPDIDTVTRIRRTEEGRIFGTVSGTITTLGVVMGLWRVSRSRKPIVVAILGVAIADSLSDATGWWLATRDDKISLDVLVGKFFIPLFLMIPFFAVNNVDYAVAISMAMGALIVWMQSQNALLDMGLFVTATAGTYFVSALVP